MALRSSSRPSSFIPLVRKADCSFLMVEVAGSQSLPNRWQPSAVGMPSEAQIPEPVALLELTQTLRRRTNNAKGLKRARVGEREDHHKCLHQ